MKVSVPFPDGMEVLSLAFAPPPEEDGAQRKHTREFIIVIATKSSAPRLELMSHGA